MAPELQAAKTEIDTLRAEIAHLENVQIVRAQVMSTEEYAAMSKEIAAKRKQLDKATKQAAKLLKARKPARI